MVGEIVLAVLSFVTGMVIPKVLGLHKCKYDVIYHQPVTAFPTGVSHGKSSSESYLGANFNSKATFVTCKQCSICHARTVRISDGSDREFRFDKEFILTHIDIEMKKEKEKQEKELLSRMDDLMKTPEQRAADAKIKAVEDEAMRNMMNNPPEVVEKKDYDVLKARETESDKILAQLKGMKAMDDAMRGQVVEKDYNGNIVYIAHREDGDDVHIVRNKKRKGKIRG